MITLEVIFSRLVNYKLPTREKFKKKKKKDRFISIR